jgi:hypothetical protein
MTVLSDAVHTARKEHHCDQCWRKIEKGQKYRRQVNTEEGLQTYRAHLDCDALADEMHKIGGLRYDECVCLREDVDACDDRPWIAEKYPEVAKRLWG